MYKTVSRVFVSMIAVFLVLSLIAPAFASEDLGVGSDTAGIQVLYGTPNPAQFPTTGKYMFEFDANITLQVKKPGDSGFSATGIKTPQALFEYGGLSLKAPKDQSGWQGGDTFYITIIGGVGGGGLSPVVDSVTLKKGGSTASRILKGSSIDAQFTIIDPNATHAAVDPESVKVLYETSAFYRSGTEALIAEKKADSFTGKATFNIELKNLKYSGKGNNIKFTVLYTAGGKEYSASILHIATECVEYKDPDDNNITTDSEAKDADPLKPYIIVESYTYGDNSVTAGTEFTLKMTLRNTSETHTLENIKMSVIPSGVFSISSSSNTFFIEELFAGGTIEKEVVVYTGLTKLGDDKAINSIDMKFDFQYIVSKKRIDDGIILYDKTRTDGTSSESIAIPVMFPDRFEMTEPTIPSTVYVGEEFPVYIPFVNKGRSTIYNMSAELIGATASDGQKQYIGNVNAGTENSIEFSVRPKEAGDINGKVLITYEDANMNLKELEVPFAVTVQEAFFPDEPGVGFPGNVDKPTDVLPTEDKSSEKTVLGISFVAIVAMSAYIKVKKIKLQRSEFDDEAI